MRLTIMTVGRLKAGPERELCTRYEERFGQIARSVGLDRAKLVELAESPARRPEDRMAEEARALLATVSDTTFIIALDERGQSLGSPDLARRIGGERDQGRSEIAVIVGGPDGLDESVRRRADLLLSFGAMTIPHQIVRALVLEQFYRVATILSGHPYHRV